MKAIINIRWQDSWGCVIFREGDTVDVLSVSKGVAKIKKGKLIVSVDERHLTILGDCDLNTGQGPI